MTSPWTSCTLSLLRRVRGNLETASHTRLTILLIVIPFPSWTAISKYQKLMIRTKESVQVEALRSCSDLLRRALLRTPSLLHSRSTRISAQAVRSRRRGRRRARVLRNSARRSLKTSMTQLQWSNTIHSSRSLWNRPRLNRRQIFQRAVWPLAGMRYQHRTWFSKRRSSSSEGDLGGLIDYFSVSFGMNLN